MYPAPFSADSKTKVILCLTPSTGTATPSLIRGLYLYLNAALVAALSNIFGRIAFMTSGSQTAPVIVTVYSNKTQPSMPLSIALLGY